MSRGIMVFILLMSYNLGSVEYEFENWFLGSQYALIRSMAEKGSFAIDGYEGPAGSEVAIRDGQHYSSKSPGIPFLCLPFYEIGTILSGKMNLGEMRRQQFVKMCVLFVPAASAALAAYLMGCVLIRLGLSSAWSWMSAMLFGLGSQCSKMAATLYYNAPSAVLMMIGIYALIRLQERSGRWPVLLGVVAGIAYTVEMSMAIMIPAIYLVLAAGNERRKSLMLFTVFLLVSLIPLFIYQHICFGAFWLDSYRFLPGAGKVEGWIIFKIPTFYSIYYTLLGTDKIGKTGLLIMTPIAIFTPLGIWHFARRWNWRVAGFLFAISAALFLVFSAVTDPNHPSFADIRYLGVLQMLGIMLGCAAIGTWYRELRESHSVFSWFVAALFAVLAAWQITIHLYFRNIVADRTVAGYVMDVVRGGRVSDLFREGHGVRYDPALFAVAFAVMLALERGYYYWQSTRGR